MFDPVKNFAITRLKADHDAGDSELVLFGDEKDKYPDPDSDGSFNLTWWDMATYAYPADDPNREIVRVTGNTAQGFSITRGVEGTTASDKNNPNAKYAVMLTWTAKTIEDIKTTLNTYIKNVSEDNNPTLSANLDANGNKIINLTNPTSDQDAATKAYVDAIKQGLDIKDVVRVASTTDVNLTVAGDGTVDGVTLADGDRILLKEQTEASENGIYIANTATDQTTWTRAADADADAEVTAGMFTFVQEGDKNSGGGYVLISSDPITVGTTDLNFVQFSSAVDIDTDQLEYGIALSKEVTLGNLGSSQTIDASAATSYVGTLNANTTITISNLESASDRSQQVQLTLKGDGTQRTITWSGIDKWQGGSAPDAPDTAGQDMLVTIVKNDGVVYASGGNFS